MNKKALFTAAMGADPATVQEISENRFAIVTPNEANGTPTTRGEYQVWTPEEAASFGYDGIDRSGNEEHVPGAGGTPTTDPGYFVYRIF